MAVCPTRREKLPCIHKIYQAKRADWKTDTAYRWLLKSGKILHAQDYKGIVCSYVKVEHASLDTHELPKMPNVNKARL